MQFIGILNNDSDIHLQLREKGFQCLFQGNKFFFFIKNNNPQRDFSSLEYLNVYLLIIGSVTNGEEIIKKKDISSKEIGEILCKSIIQNYIEKGETIFSQLDGSYVIILWDKNKKKLYINRDCYGTKLLYYYFKRDKGIIFSNSLDMLIKTKEQRNISRKALHEYLRFLDISPPYTIYEDVFTLEPEKMLILDNGERVFKNIKGQDGDEQRNISLPEAIENCKSLLVRSIERRIKNSQRIGVFLSGGIDSSLICAIASRINSNLKVYTVGFDNPRYDESLIAKDITQFLGLEHHIFKFSLKEDYQAFNDFVSIIPSPFADPAVIPTFQCFQKISDSVDVVLDGTGADSLIGIMPARHIRFILQYTRHIPFGLRQVFSLLLRKTKTLSSYSDLFDFNDPEELLIRWKGWTKEEISKLCEEECDMSHTRHYKLFAEHSQKSPFTLYSLLIGTAPDDRLHNLSSIFELNVVFPFFDKHVQEFVKKLPQQYRYTHAVSKILLKKTLEQFIPPSIWNKPKHGFDYPFDLLLHYKEFELIKQYLSVAALRDSGFFNHEMIQDYTHQLKAGNQKVKFKIWGLVIFQAWYLTYYKNLFSQADLQHAVS